MRESVHAGNSYQLGRGHYIAMVGGGLSSASNALIKTIIVHMRTAAAVIAHMRTAALNSAVFSALTVPGSARFRERIKIGGGTENEDQGSEVNGKKLGSNSGL